MKHIIAIALAVGGFACGGDEADSDLAHPNAKPTDYIDAETLALAENEAQEICLLSGFIGAARFDECGFHALREDAYPSDAEIIEDCAKRGMPVHQGLLTQQSCHEVWAQAKCEDLVGPRSDGGRPELCRMVYDPDL